MDDMIYRNDPIAEENIDPHGRPATDEFEEWSEEVSERMLIPTVQKFWDHLLDILKHIPAK